MKKSLTLIVSASILFAAIVSITAGNAASGDHQKAKKSKESKKPKESKKSEKKLRHVVLFKFKDGTSKEQIGKIVKGFAELKGKIDVIQDFEWGTNNSPEKLADGFTHLFFVTFRDEKGRNTYLPHPAHKAFVKLLKPHLDKVLVVDYWAKG